MLVSSCSFGSSSFLLGDDDVCPALRLAQVLPHDLGEHLHPSVLLRSAVGVEVNSFSVGEADTETLLHEHVPFFFLGEGRFPSSTRLARRLLLNQRRLVVNQLTRLGKIDGGTRLSCGFMVGSKLRTVQREESSTPVLHGISVDEKLTMAGLLPGSRHLAG